MELKTISSKWTQVAGLLLIGGAVAWILKLGVIIFTNGRIIDTGAAALLMKIGLLLLIVGSTGIGNYFCQNRTYLLRILAIIISPIVVFGSFLLFAMITTPLLENITVWNAMWYAQEETPIALAVIYYLTIGGILYRVSCSMPR